MRQILVGLWESLHVLLNVALISQELHVGTINLNTPLLSEADVLLPSEWGEAPVLADDDLLATREFVHGAAESFDRGGTVGITGANTEEDLANIDTSDNAVRLTESTTHTGLESIGSSTRQHLVDTDDVIRVGADAEVETFFTGNLDEVSGLMIWHQ